MPEESWDTQQQNVETLLQQLETMIHEHVMDMNATTTAQRFDSDVAILKRAICSKRKFDDDDMEAESELFGQRLSQSSRSAAAREEDYDAIWNTFTQSIQEFTQKESERVKQNTLDMHSEQFNDKTLDIQTKLDSCLQWQCDHMEAYASVPEMVQTYPESFQTYYHQTEQLMQNMQSLSALAVKIANLPEVDDVVL